MGWTDVIFNPISTAEQAAHSIQQHWTDDVVDPIEHKLSMAEQTVDSDLSHIEQAVSNTKQQVQQGWTDHVVDPIEQSPIGLVASGVKQDSINAYHGLQQGIQSAADAIHDDGVVGAVEQGATGPVAYSIRLVQKSIRLKISSKM